MNIAEILIIVFPAKDLWVNLVKELYDLKTLAKFMSLSSLGFLLQGQKTGSGCLKQIGCVIRIQLALMRKDATGNLEGLEQ